MRPNIEDLIAAYNDEMIPETGVIRASVIRECVVPDRQDIAYYSQLDPTLAQLYKNYREAEAHYIRLDDGTDRNAAMREVAQDMKDSAWSALQTRLIEIREGDETVTAMQAMRNLRHDDKVCLSQKRELENARQTAFRRQRETAEPQKKQAREDAADALLAYVFLFWFRLRWGVSKPVTQPRPRSEFTQVA